MANTYAGYALPYINISWGRACRVIPSRFPPIHLFEDLGNPADWEVLAEIESFTNPRLQESIGELDKLPIHQRPSGPGTTYRVAPFVHASEDHPGRFNSGGFGALYLAETLETALREVCHHHGCFLASTSEPSQWTGTFRVLRTALTTTVFDGRIPDFAKPDDCAQPQHFAAEARLSEENGVLYDSLRNPGALCAALFRPDASGPLIQGEHIRYHWNGSDIDMVEHHPGSPSARIEMLG